MRCPINWTPKRCGHWVSRGNRGGPYGPPLLLWGAGGLWPPDWLEQLWLSSHSAGNRGAARPCARHSPSKGPAPLAEPCRESDLSGAGPVSARTFKSRTCTGPLSYGGRCAAAFLLAARAPSTATRTRQGRPAPGIKGRALALALTRRAAMCYGPSPLRQPIGRARWQGRAHPKAKSVCCPPRAMPGPKA